MHPEAGDLGRNWPLELGVVGDELAFLDGLGDRLPQRRRDAWIGEVATARATYEQELERNYQTGLQYSADTGALHPSVIGKVLNDFLYHGDLDPRQTLTGWGGFSWQRSTVPMLRAYRAGQEIVCPYRVRGHRAGHGDDDRRRHGGEGRERSSGALQRGPERLPDHRLPGWGSRWSSSTPR